MVLTLRDQATAKASAPLLWTLADGIVLLTASLRTQTKIFYFFMMKHRPRKIVSSEKNWGPDSFFFRSERKNLTV